MLLTADLSGLGDAASSLQRQQQTTEDGCQKKLGILLLLGCERVKPVLLMADLSGLEDAALSLHWQE